jgi:thymidylate kinase
LIGIDGTGKTTHALGIIDYLQKSGYKCKYVWFGSPYFFSFPFMVICRLLGYTKTHYLANGTVVSEHQYYKNKSLSRLWPWVQFIDILISVDMRVKVPLLFGFAVVCDRFVPDTLVELMTDVKDVGLHERLVGRLIIKSMPKSSRLMLLDVNEKTALRRKNDVLGLGYLTRRRNEYLLISRDLRIPIVNGEAPLGDVKRNLLTLITETK